MIKDDLFREVFGGTPETAGETPALPGECLARQSMSRLQRIFVDGKRMKIMLALILKDDNILSMKTQNAERRSQERQRPGRARSPRQMGKNGF
jgi:hypothetical protein